MARFIDLDEIAPAPVTVQIHGVRYQLPGDIPVPDYFALDLLSRKILGLEPDSEDEDPTGPVQDLHDRLLGLFQVHQPDLDQLPVGPRLLLPLVFRYLNPDAGVEEEPQDAPPPRGGTKTKPAGSPRSKKTKTSKPRPRTGSGS